MFAALFPKVTPVPPVDRLTSADQIFFFVSRKKRGTHFPSVLRLPALSFTANQRADSANAGMTLDSHGLGLTIRQPSFNVPPRPSQQNNTGTTKLPAFPRHSRIQTSIPDSLLRARHVSDALPASNLRETRLYLFLGGDCLCRATAGNGGFPFPAPLIPPAVHE
jgi:hypothetical protein